MRSRMRTHGMGQVNGRPCSRSVPSSIMSNEQQADQTGKGWNLEFKEGVCNVHDMGI